MAKSVSIPKNEDELQILCVAWFERNYGETSFLYNEEQVFIYHIPNQGKRSINYTRKLVRMGMKAGMPDLCICSAKKGYIGLYIELKHGKGKRNRRQIQIAEKLSKDGYLVIEVRSLDEFKRRVIHYLGGNKNV